MRLMTLTLLATLTLPVSANNYQAIVRDDLPKILKHALDTKGWQTVSKFDTGSNVTGWVVKTHSGLQVAFTDDQGNLILGEMVNPDGVVMNNQFLAGYSEKLDFASILKDAEFIKLHAGSQSPVPDEVIVVYEPFCPHCSTLFAALLPYIKAGKSVKLLPVAMLSDGSDPRRPSSTDLIYSLLSATDPKSQVLQHELQGIPRSEVKSASADVATKISHNLKVMHDLGIPGTPAMLVPTNGGYKIHHGVVGMAELPSILKMKRIDSDDKRLIPFGADPLKYPESPAVR